MVKIFKIIAIVLGAIFLLVMSSLIFKIPINSIHGTINLINGDCMPSDRDLSCKNNPMANVTVQIRESYNQENLHNTYPRYADFIDSLRLIRELKTDENGKYTTSLPVGSYSIFVIINDEKQYTDTNYFLSLPGFYQVNSTVNTAAY